MTSNRLETVQVDLLSQALTKYCMIYFDNSSRLESILRINHILKYLMLKILRIYFYFMDYCNTFQKIRIKIWGHRTNYLSGGLLRHKAGQEGRGEILLENSFMR